MEYIAHRVNTKAELALLPDIYGVELDLRDDLNGRIYIQHNPFVAGEDFEEYLQGYHHGTMILNVKSERIEHKVLELVKKYDIKKYFFLDSTYPMIKLLSDLGERNIALRFSEFEGIETLEVMQGKVEWVWVDCFTKFPMDKVVNEKIKAMDYKICIVSPELQGQQEKLEEYKKLIKDGGMVIDAICTKVYNIPTWQK